MKFNPVTTQPNFTAKVKNNDFMQNYVANSSKNNLENLKTSLKELNKVYPEDTLEINRNKKGGFDVKNENKKTSVSFSAEKTTVMTAESPLEVLKPLSLPKLLKNIATKGTEEFNKVFGVKPEEKQPSKVKKEAPKFEKASAQDQKEVLDMLA